MACRRDPVSLRDGRRPGRAPPPGARPSTDDVSSAKQAVGLGQEFGEVELVGAGGAGGFEVGARPVAGGGVEGGVLATGLGADAVVLVVGEEPGQVAQL